MPKKRRRRVYSLPQVDVSEPHGKILRAEARRVRVQEKVLGLLTMSKTTDR